MSLGACVRVLIQCVPYGDQPVISTVLACGTCGSYPGTCRPDPAPHRRRPDPGPSPPAPAALPTRARHSRGQHPPPRARRPWSRLAYARPPPAPRHAAAPEPRPGMPTPAGAEPRSRCAGLPALARWPAGGLLAGPLRGLPLLGGRPGGLGARGDGLHGRPRPGPLSARVVEAAEPSQRGGRQGVESGVGRCEPCSQPAPDASRAPVDRHSNDGAEGLSLVCSLLFVSNAIAFARE